MVFNVALDMLFGVVTWIELSEIGAFDCYPRSPLWFILLLRNQGKEKQIAV